ncbi:MAG: hypothetical protein PHY31_00250, partial [Smithellaceae bacterium]|nr:hypothetical protein [Smithellaceae bacterium]
MNGKTELDKKLNPGRRAGFTTAVLFSLVFIALVPAVVIDTSHAQVIARVAGDGLHLTEMSIEELMNIEV